MRTRSAAPSRTRRRRRAVIILLVAVAVVAAVVAAVVIATRPSTAPPAAGQRLLVVAGTPASQAANAAPSADQRAAAYLAERPTALWLVPEEHGIGSVGTFIESLFSQAREQDAAVTLVVYGLPGRDCGQFSAGGLEADDYVEWMQQIAAALRAETDVMKIVILEPDSLALAPECGNVDERTVQLRGAVDALADSGSWVYLDGGHSSWLAPAVMAGLLRGVGTDDVRGFATNVSNYNDLRDETEYAHEVAALLDGAHAVIDTSRSGAGSTGEWCNPADRRVGEEGGAFGDDVVDLNLWIKPPGESDGTCNGGPPAGQWWPESARQLTRDSIG